jgi:hypothetical protein
MLNQKEDSLLTEVGSEKIAPEVWEPVRHEGIVGLTESEMAVVLNELWLGSGVPTPHEPTDGQMNMERAIDMGKTCLNTLVYKELIPERVLDYEKVNAYLEKRVPRTQNWDDIEPGGYNPIFNPIDVRPEEQLEPFFSYWTAIFEGKDTNIKIVMDAVTGGVWKMRVTYLLADDDLGKDFSKINDKIRAFFLWRNPAILSNYYENMGALEGMEDLTGIEVMDDDMLGLIGLDVRGGIPPTISVGEPAGFSMELMVRLYEPLPYLSQELEDILGEWIYSHSTKKDGTPITLHEFEAVPPLLRAYEELTAFKKTDEVVLSGNIEIRFHENTVFGTAYRNQNESNSFEVYAIAVIFSEDGTIVPHSREDLLLYDPDSDSIRYHIGGTDVYHYFVKR